MSAQIRATLQGGEDLKRQLARMGVDVATVLDAAVAAGAKIIADEADVNAPGPNIDTDRRERSRTRVTYAIGPVKSKWYYVFIESGAKRHFEPNHWYFDEHIHPGITARPFLEPALESEKKEAEKEVGKRLRRAIV